jgi:hypothetical protein
VRGSTHRTNGVVVVVVGGAVVAVVDGTSGAEDVEVVVSIAATGSAPDDPTI